jgi:hypothetical protein
MKTTSEIERQARQLMLATKIEADICDEGHIMYVFFDENGEVGATFKTFIEAYRYRMMYIICKLEG